ncbi:TetR/AcrR family transcriptional regulator [Paracoccus subflavus]|uniref:TetR/AcrR family transcriptional regulator n=1 Tax=Paracoccus subflavus TaxID=2528244 RepID=A0A4Q9G594_9RHOB|nr:TetR/AcrR family transcriptional regulator [Paracoccus subflavus]TBN43868.1 TetR/AcrR family transcriptional regulator [Paracoccus subflavus]
MPTRGNLPEALVQAGIALLDEDGTEALSLRRIAARAGVSHAAPAHHFGGLPGLKTAMAIRGFQQFQQHLMAARDAVPADAPPFQRLSTVADAYVRFAGMRTGLFQLMFDQLAASDPDLLHTALGSYLLIKELCAPFVDGRPAVAVETAVWSLTHGYAALNLDRPRPSDTQVATSALVDALRLIID